MRFDKTITHKGEVFKAGDYINIPREMFEAMKAWANKKSYKNFRAVCRHCFYDHSWTYAPFKLKNVIKHTWFDKFYMQFKDANPIDEKE